MDVDGPNLLPVEHNFAKNDKRLRVGRVTGLGFLGKRWKLRFHAGRKIGCEQFSLKIVDTGFRNMALEAKRLENFLGRARVLKRQSAGAVGADHLRQSLDVLYLIGAECVVVVA